MKIHQQVVSQELSKQLFDVGVLNPFNFYWIFQKGEKIGTVYSGSVPYDSNLEWYPAYTVAELGEAFPPANYPDMAWRIWKKKHSWHMSITTTEQNVACTMITEPFSAKTEADCRALALLYFVKHGFSA